MATRHQYNLTDNSTYPASTVLVLHGDGTPYSGSGTPWTGTSSPYQISMNDATGGVWTPQSPTPAMVLSGTPPFSVGSTPVYRGYGNIQTQIGIQMYATSYNNAADLLNRLKRAFAAGITTPYPVLTLAPNGSSNNSRFYVVSAVVQETPAFLNQEVAAYMIRAIISLELRPLVPGTQQTLNNAASMSVAGTGSPSNFLSYGTGKGELIADGSPLVLSIDAGAFRPTKMYLATARARHYSTTGAATYTTTSTSGALGSNVVTESMTDGVATFDNYPNLYCGLFVHASVASNAQFRLEVAYGPGAVSPMYTTPWISSTGAVAQLIYAGAFLTSAFANGTGTTPHISIRYRSTNGASAAVVVTSWQFVFFYELLIVNPDYTNNISVKTITVNAYDSNGFPISPVVFGFSPSTSYANDRLDARGTAPAYHAGCGLFCAYMTGTTGLYTTTNTMTATVNHSPLYQTLIGASL